MGPKTWWARSEGGVRAGCRTWGEGQAHSCPAAVVCALLDDADGARAPRGRSETRPYAPQLSFWLRVRWVQIPHFLLQISSSAA